VDIEKSIIENKRSYEYKIGEDSQDMMHKKYKMQNLILNVGRDNQIIFYKNLNFAYKKMQEVIQHQFVGFRDNFEIELD
jgi:hypothetical protein